MATIIVNTTLDENDGSLVDGDVSLRDAIAAANSGDTITFASGAGDAFETGGTIRLAEALGELAVTKDLTIDGDVDDDGAPNVTITGDTLGDDVLTLDPLGNTITDAGNNNANTSDNVRVLNVTGGTFALDGLVITGGFSSFDDNKGGGVLVTNDTVLMVCNSSVSGNSGPDGEGGAAGIHNAGTLILTDTTVSGNKHSSYMGSRGGGLFNEGTAILSNSTVSDNGAGAGGGILNSGTLTLTDTTVSGNRAEGGGGIANRGILTVTDTTVADNLSEYGAGGISNGGTATLINTTVSGNRSVDSNGGGIENSGDLTLTNATVSGNRSGFSRDGGGIFNMGTAILTNTTVSGNTAAEIDLAGGSGGGIFNSGTAALTLANTIVLGNRAFIETPGLGNTPIASDIEGTFTATAPNLIGGSAGDVFAAIDPDTGGGLLADNGGAARTLALKNDASNPALDAGQDDRLDETVAGIDLNGDGDTDDIIDTDTRGDGFARTADLPGVANNGASTVDLGAFEVPAVPTGAIIHGTGDADTITPGVVSVGVTGVQPSDGDDTIAAYGANDTVDGGGGADRIDGGSGNDSLSGDGGDDTLKGSFGYDTLDGGEGTDTADLSHTGADADINLAVGQVVFSGGVETLIGIENAIGTNGDNFINGTSGANRLEGGGGDDTLKGGLGYDTLDGGDGIDTADLSHTGAAATVDLAAGEVVFGGGVETLIGIENAIGTNGDNLINGTSGANSLEGGGGDDTLHGHGGPDRFVFAGTAFDRDTITDLALGTDKIVFDGVGGATAPDDLSYAARDFNNDGANDGIRITFAGLGDELWSERIDVLDVGTNIEALKADILFV